LDLHVALTGQGFFTSYAHRYFTGAENSKLYLKNSSVCIGVQPLTPFII